jgi:hypothetical protein
MAPLAGNARSCYSSPPAFAAQENQPDRKVQLVLKRILACRIRKKEVNAGVDELHETLHNLASLLLMNTTLHHNTARQYRISSLTINSR